MAQASANKPCTWLANASDAWVATGRVDPTGHSGTCIGQEVDMSLRYQIDPRAEIEVGYAHFVAGQVHHAFENDHLIAGIDVFPAIAGACAPVSACLHVNSFG